MHVVDLEQQVNEIEPAFFPDTDMFFLVFTRLNPTVGQRINFNDVQSVLNSNFNANHPTRFTIHGWIGDGTSQTNQAIREQYFIHGEYNVSSSARFLLSNPSTQKLSDGHRRLGCWCNDQQLHHRS